MHTFSSAPTVLIGRLYHKLIFLKSKAEIAFAFLSPASVLKPFTLRHTANSTAAALCRSK